jgi:hypothetical protein
LEKQKRLQAEQKGKAGEDRKRQQAEKFKHAEEQRKREKEEKKKAVSANAANAEQNILGQFGT